VVVATCPQDPKTIKDTIGGRSWLAIVGDNGALPLYVVSSVIKQRQALDDRKQMALEYGPVARSGTRNVTTGWLPSTGQCRE